MATSQKRDGQTQKFKEIYNKLNAQQKQAVDTIEGPVMVIAGPGTGKTQILGARIGKILLETDTQPDNILCLTYTDAGTIAMRKRLLSFIGADAYKVHIYTFHAFCNDVIQENLSLFDKTSLDPVTDLQRVELYKQLIDGFGKNHPLKRYRGDVYFEIHNLQYLFSAMKREGWSPQYISERIDAYIDDLPNRDEYIYKRKYKEFKAGDLKADKIAEEALKMDKLRAAVNEFDTFQRMMHERKLYDFDDMINWVIKAFDENKELLNRYQEQYLYTLVDEYQDTSGTQNKIIELLINYWDNPNVFVVGDDDQSIYRFQGANVENMMTFVNSYKELLRVVLTDNYRSTQPILDVSKTLISRNEERLITKMPGLSKELLSSNSSLNHLLHLPSVKEYNAPREEMIGITLEVEALIAKGVKPNCIGIIYRENKYGDELSKYFKLRKIPQYSRRRINLLNEPLIQNILTVLRYIAAEHDIPYEGDEMLFEILHYNWFTIPPMEIAKLTMEVSERQFTQNKTSIRRLLYDKATQPPRDLFAKPLHQKLKAASAFLERLIGDVSNITLMQLLEKLIRESGALNCIMQAEDKHWQMQLITGLYDFIKEETSRSPLLSLQQLVNIFDLMERENIPMPLIQVNGSEKGVNLMTAHGSKGLEYEYIFIAGSNAAGWEKKRKPAGGYSLPDTLFVSLSPNAEEEELRRLFYVALTRAQKHLTVSYPVSKADGKLTEPSMFIEEIKEEHPMIQTEMIFLPEEVMTEFRALEFDVLQSPEIARMERDAVAPRIDKFVMNVSALNNYLRCPLEFYFRNVINIPSPRNEAAEFGSAVHYALQRLFEQMQRYNEFPSAQSLIQDFESYMHRRRELFTKEQFDRRMEYGPEILANYYNTYISKWTMVVAIERNIKGVVVNGIPMKGKIDKLEFDGTDVNVVDYKTGDLEKAKPNLVLPNDKQPNGGDYWRQAVFYKILLDNYAGRKWNAVSFEFDFIEPDKKNEYHRRKVRIEPEDITTVTQQMTSVWNKIQEHDFYTGCGKPDCHWCNFVKTNKMAIALHEIEPVIGEEV